MRQPGSGLSKLATDAVEKMLAARLRSDAPTIKEQMKILDRAYKSDQSWMTGKRVFDLVDQTCEFLSLDVSDAQVNPSDHLGDVFIKMSDGSKLWIEVKGQTKKERFRDITQADYVREGTDFLRKYARLNPKFNQLIVGNLRLELLLDKNADSLKSWDLEGLWVADLALLVDEERRSRAGVHSSADLPKFLKKKYLFHLCMEGARIVRLDQLKSVKAVLSGEKFHTVLNTSNQSVASVQVAVGEPPRLGRTAFTYHVGYNNAPGRHKLHDVTITSSEDVKVFN
jgi:hypothetical protein